MELVNVLQILDRHRLLVGVGLVLAMVAGLAGAGVLPGAPSAAGSGSTTGLAQSRMLLDTDDPLAVDLEAQADTIGAQTALLADLLAAEPQVRAIARGAGIAPDALVVRRTALTLPAAPSRLGAQAASAGTPARPYAVDVVASLRLPIVSIDAFAPTVREAEALAESSGRALEELVAGREGGLTLKMLEPVTALSVPGTSGLGILLGPIAALAVFALWSGALVLGSGVARLLRERTTLPEASG